MLTPRKEWLKMLTIRCDDPNGVLVYLDVYDGAEFLYTLEVGRQSGVVCLKYSGGWCTNYWPCNHYGLDFPNEVLEAILKYIP
jgi:hypothetical protein